MNEEKVRGEVSPATCEEVKENSELSRLLTKEVSTKVKGIDEVLDAYRHSIDLSPVLKGVIAANAIYELNKAIDDKMMKGLMFLAGTSLGFKTDKDNWGDGYSVEVVKKCCIQALLFGVNITGNQFNIIKGNVYITKEGFTYLLGNVKGLDYSVVPTIPEEENKVNRVGAVVNVLVKWKKGRGAHEENLSFFCKGDKDKQGNILTQMDSYIAKAERKAKHWLYHRITGTMLGEAEVEEVAVNKEETKETIPVKIGKSVELLGNPEKLTKERSPMAQSMPVINYEKSNDPEKVDEVAEVDPEEGEKVASALKKIHEMQEEPPPKKITMADKMREEAKSQVETK